MDRVTRMFWLVSTGYPTNWVEVLKHPEGEAQGDGGRLVADGSCIGGHDGITYVMSCYVMLRWRRRAQRGGVGRSSGGRRGPGYYKLL